VLDRFRANSRTPLFFSHIPKTAGTSLRSFLANQYHPSEICPANDWDGLSRIPAGEVCRYRLLQGHFGLNARSLAPADARTVVVLREPLARTLSNIRHMQRDPDFHPLHPHVKGKSISEILQDEMLKPWFRNQQACYLCTQRSAAEVLDNIRRGFKNPWGLEDLPDLELAKEYLAKVDFTGTVEELPELIRVISEKMNFHPPVFVPHVNETHGADSLPGLTAEEMALLRECNDVDLPLYEHARALARRRAARVAPKTVQQALEALCEAGVYKPMQDSFELDLRDIVPGSGWYQAEIVNNRPQRWTGPSADFTLELPIQPDASYTGVLLLWSARPLSSETLSVMVNGRRQPIVLSNLRETYELSFPIPKDLLADNHGVCEVLFRLSSVFRPSDSGGTDLRKLGIIVSSAKFLRSQA
jgi:hypothetical protein